MNIIKRRYGNWAICQCSWDASCPNVQNLPMVCLYMNPYKGLATRGTIDWKAPITLNIFPTSNGPTHWKIEKKRCIQYFSAFLENRIYLVIQKHFLEWGSNQYQKTSRQPSFIEIFITLWPHFTKTWFFCKLHALYLTFVTNDLHVVVSVIPRNAITPPT